MNGLRRATFLSGAIFAALATAAAPGAAKSLPEPLTVSIDQATVAKLPNKVATIVIGNPLIADATRVKNGDLLVVTGKSYGSTNVLALDQAGNILVDWTVQVRGPRDQVIVVYRGPQQRETYSCQPKCERRITLGDSPDYFKAVIEQSGDRNTRALGK